MCSCCSFLVVVVAVDVVVTVVVEVVVVAIDVVITGLMVLKMAHFYSSISSLINIFLCIIS